MLNMASSSEYFPSCSGTEIEGCLDFIRKVYGIFGFEFHMKLSTRPENALGDTKLWDRYETGIETEIQIDRKGERRRRK